MSKSYRDERKADLLAYVGRWFDRCVETGYLDDHCEMGRLKIELFDGGSYTNEAAVEEGVDQERLIAIYMTPTFPLEQI